MCYILWFWLFLLLFLFVCCFYFCCCCLLLFQSCFKGNSAIHLALRKLALQVPLVDVNNQKQSPDSYVLKF